MHKSARSTSQKHKTEERSNSGVQSESVAISRDSTEFVELIHFIQEEQRKLIFNIKDISIDYDKLDENSNIGILCSDYRKSSRGLIYPALRATDTLREINSNLRFLKSQVHKHITANVSFDKTLNKWIAICEQLKITTHAQDMESVVSKLEDLLSKHDKVDETYQLTVNFTKFVTKDSNKKEKIPYFVGIGIPTFESWYAEDKLFNDFQIPIYEGHLIIEEELSKSYSKKNEEINEFPHIDVDRLARLAEEKSYTMPRGLTREQRREWARKNLKR